MRACVWRSSRLRGNLLSVNPHSLDPALTFSPQLAAAASQTFLQKQREMGGLGGRPPPPPPQTPPMFAPRRAAARQPVPTVGFAWGPCLRFPLPCQPNMCPKNKQNKAEMEGGVRSSKSGRNAKKIPGALARSLLRCSCSAVAVGRDVCRM